MADQECVYVREIHNVRRTCSWLCGRKCRYRQNRQLFAKTWSFQTHFECFDKICGPQLHKLCVTLELSFPASPLLTLVSWSFHGRYNLWKKNKYVARYNSRTICCILRNKFYQYTLIDLYRQN